MPDSTVISLTVLHTVLAVNGVMVLGIVLRLSGLLRPEADRSLFNVTLYLLMPCLILDNLLFAETFSDLRNVIVPPILGFLGILVGMSVVVGFTYLLPRRLTGIENEKQRGTFAACTGMFNYGFVPIPLIAALYPNDSSMLGTLFLQNVGVEIAVWTLTLLAISGRLQRDSWKKAINPPTITIAVALGFQLLRRLPIFPAGTEEILLPHLGFFRQALHLLGAAAIPMNVLLVGGTIADQFDWQRMKTEWPRGLKVAFWSCVFRLGILASLFLVAAIFLPVPPEVKRVLVIHGAMSSAVFPIVMAKFYGGDSPTAVFAVIGNTILGLVTTPLWIGFGLTWIAR